MTTKPWGGILAWGIAASVFAQGATTPAPAAGAAREAASATVQTETTASPGGAGVQDQKAGRPGRAVTSKGKLPMDIRLRDGGVKMPKCSEESREGLACK